MNIIRNKWDRLSLGNKLNQLKKRYGRVMNKKNKQKLSLLDKHINDILKKLNHSK